LPKATAALDPPTGLTIQKNGRLTGGVKIPNPKTPKAREAFRNKNAVKGIPTNRVERLLKVKLKND
jgi:hypothetical protein